MSLATAHHLLQASKRDEPHPQGKDRTKIYVVSKDELSRLPIPYDCSVSTS